LKTWLSSLSDRVLVLTITGFVGGLIIMWFWNHSVQNWHLYQNNAYHAGRMLYNSLVHLTDPPSGINIGELSPADKQYAMAGEYTRIQGIPQNSRLTIVPLKRHTGNTALLTLSNMRFMIFSSEITFPTRELNRTSMQSGAETTAELSKLLASYCANTVLLVQLDTKNFKTIEGSSVWGCESAPRDLRLIVLIAALAFVASVTTLSLNSTRDFDLFAKTLRIRNIIGSNSHFESRGPKELRNLVSALNDYLQSESDNIEKRAALLSGVSHDLGTPATRLRLRTALIEDADLRGKLENDIDSMTSMIDSVLQYTRAELNSELPRKLFLNTLVESVVSDYQDTGHPVTFAQAEDVVVKGASSIFTSVHGNWKISGDRNIIVVCQPISLQRAINNLIDNALKYGRSAELSLEASSMSVDICVDDEGGEFGASQLEALTQPFKRGENTGYTSGHGLGLTIVDAIAKQHGGKLGFENHKYGTRARLSIPRN
jgi:signal transduction histidine kinase